jgi:hypothetical protein
MARMTEEEAAALDEELTRTTPRLKGENNGIFTRRAQLREMRTLLDSEAAEFIIKRAEASGKEPAAVLNDIVRREIAYA